MELLLEFIGAPANAVTLVIAIGIIIFQLIDRGYLKIGRSVPEKTAHDMEAVMAPLLDRMGRLEQYANHNTTERLEQLQEMVRHTNQLLGELVRYGIKCRKD